ncbi:GTPase IMAP family member 2-like protein [Aix galericulata]|nr:GTPase IMAP family member 2-like protein [Aix galericulata]
MEMRLILAGKAGGGKSATGNTLLGECVFESKLSTQPVTVSCARAEGHWDGEDFTVVDTADIFNPGDASSEMYQEIIRCISLSSPGPHALLLVTQLGRFTQEDKEAAERLQDIFGADVLQHTIVIFTRAEELAGESLHNYVKYSKNRALRKLIERCGKRYCGFNNRATGAERDQQVAELMGTVRMVQANRDRYYSNEMYLEPSLTEEEVAYHMESVAVAARCVHVLPGVGGGMEMRLILAGKAGGGKSATGNTLLGECVFESKLSTQPVTVSCARAEGHWDGEDFTVVDTADIFNPGDASSEMYQEIIRCISLSSPGPHALLLVTQLGRFTQEDEEAAERLQDIFGADVLQHTIVIFTRAEELAGESLHNYVKYSKNRALRKLIERCGKRYCGFNNRATGAERDQQVAELMGTVRMVQANRDRYYSNEMYLEPSLTEEEVAYHMERYREDRIKREQSGCRTVVFYGLIVLTVAVVSLGYYITRVRGVPAPQNR